MLFVNAGNRDLRHVFQILHGVDEPSQLKRRQVSYGDPRLGDLSGFEQAGPLGAFEQRSIGGKPALPVKQQEIGCKTVGEAAVFDNQDVVAAAALVKKLLQALPVGPLEGVIEFAGVDKFQAADLPEKMRNKLRFFDGFSINYPATEKTGAAVGWNFNYVGQIQLFADAEEAEAALVQAAVVKLQIEQPAVA